MSIEKLQGESFLDYKYRLLVDMASGELDATWTNVDEALGLGMHKDTIRKGSIFLPEFYQHMMSKVNKNTEEHIANYKTTTEIIKDGQQKSDRLIAMNEEDMKDEKFILESHGYNPDEWQVVNAKNSIYNVNAKGGITKTLYSSKITVKPKVNGFNIDKLVEKIKENVKPYKRKNTVSNGDNMLELGFTDMHFGVNDLLYYKETLDETLDLINSKKWDTIFLPVGSDALHNNDLSKGLTANGTPIEKVDMENAWEEAYRFYAIILEHCLENANHVVAKYVCGNHDKDISFGLVKALSKVYTEVDWDTTADYKKMFTWKDVAILYMHGDKGNQQRITKSAYQDYGKIIADKKCFEIHTGDKHHTVVNDSHGVVFRILPTGAKTDQWHSEQSFSGNSKCFHLFEYKEDKLKTIYHV